MSIFV